MKKGLKGIFYQNIWHLSFVKCHFRLFYYFYNATYGTKTEKNYIYTLYSMYIIEIY